MSSPRRRLHYLQLRNRALVGLTSSAVVLFALGQVGPVTGPVNVALFAVLDVGAKFGLVAGFASFTLAQGWVAITPPTRSSRSSTASAGTSECVDTTDSAGRPDTTTGDDPVERARQRYVEGAIGELALERELEAALLETEDTSGRRANGSERAHDH